MVLSIESIELIKLMNMGINTIICEITYQLTGFYQRSRFLFEFKQTIKPSLAWIDWNELN